MKNKLKYNINTTTITIILSIIIMLYFGYGIINPILNSMNKKVEIEDNITVIKNFFK
jgi:hypothetical protein